MWLKKQTILIKRIYHQLLKNKLLFYGLLFGVFFLIAGIINADGFIRFLNAGNQSLLAVCSPYYLWVGVIIVMTSLVILFLPLGKKRLGNTKPEYSYFSWLALLYSTGMGSGLLLRAVQEPVYYLNHPPVAVADTEVLALQYTYFHWAFTPWAMYSLFGLIVAYNLYVRKVPNLLHALVPAGNNPYLKNTSIIFIVLITITGVIASLGLGSAQVVGGLNHMFHIELGNSALLTTVLLIGLVATLSALTGIHRVIKYLADFDFGCSILLMLFIALFLNFNLFFTQLFTASYQYIVHFFEMSLSIGAYETSAGFTKDWTVFYWAFWLAWVPLTGIFIARISKGRTIRQFITATILVPAFATIIWFSVFAHSAFDLLSEGNSGQFDNLYTSLFVFLEHYPFYQITFIIAVLLVMTSIINSVDSAVFVLGMLSDNGSESPSKKHKLLWGAIITATALGIAASGTNGLLNAVSNLLIIMALPFSLLYLYIIAAFFKNTLTTSSTKPVTKTITASFETIQTDSGESDPSALRQDY
jgi:glycine betaine transporter